MTSRLLVLMTISTTAMASWYDSSTEVSYAGDVIEGDTIVTSSGPSLADCQDLDWLNDTATTAEQADCVDLLEDDILCSYARTETKSSNPIHFSRL